jgi:hypothetical protein
VSLLLLSTAWAWTCAEATHIFANAPTESLGAARIRNGWSYSEEDLACLAASGLPGSVVQRLHPQAGTELHLTHTGPIETLVLDLGCGTLSVVAGGADQVSVDGHHMGEAPVFETQENTLTLRRDPQPTSCADLTVTAPAQARLLVYHRGTYVRVRGMAGPVEINAPQADVTVVGPAELVEIEALKGSVYVDVSGSVQVDGGQGVIAVGAGDGATVRTSSVAGSQFLWGGPLRRVDASSVDGHIRSQATLLPAAIVDARSQNGDVLVGVSAIQAAVLPTHTGTAPPLLHATAEGSMRPDRELPSGQRSQAYFEWMPIEVRGLWSPEGRGQLVPNIGARLRSTHTPSQAAVRITPQSLSGWAGGVQMDHEPPVALGASAAALAERLPSLGACRPDLAGAVSASQIDLWATIRFDEGSAQEVTFDTEGFDPKLVACVRDVMTSWTIPQAQEVVVDWPLKLRRVRSEATPRP